MRRDTVQATTACREKPVARNPGTLMEVRSLPNIAAGERPPIVEPAAAIRRAEVRAA
jgi:hypothetical protein